MRRMIWYEWKRIWGSRLTQFAVLGCALFLAFSVWSNIRLISATDADGQTVTGLEAVRVQKESRKEVTLDQETVDALVDEYLGYTQDLAASSDDRELMYLSEEMYVKWYLPHQPVLHLITDAYRSYPEQRNDSIRDVLLQSRGKDFYEARKERVWENLEDAVNWGEIIAAEADWWNAEDDAVGEASYGYNRPWWEIVNSTSLVILVMLVICIGTAPVFAGEYQSKCDSLLLSMRYGKSRLILAKLTSSFLFSTDLFWLNKACTFPLNSLKIRSITSYLNFCSCSLSSDFFNFLITDKLALDTLCANSFTFNKYSNAPRFDFIKFV